MIHGDSMVKGLNEYGLSKKRNVKAQSFSGYTTEDMLHIGKPAARRKPDTIIIHHAWCNHDEKHQENCEID